MVKRVLAGLLLSATACGTTLGGLSSPAPIASVPPTATAAATATPSPSPKRLDGTNVRISVDGAEQPGGVVRPLKGGPVTVRLSFPFDVERRSVEQWLGGYALTWIDDRTLDVVVPESPQGAGFKVAETLSRDGLYVLDYFVVFVDFPPTRTVNVYAAAELAKASSDFAHPATTLSSQRVHLGLRGAFALSPDARTILFFDLAAKPAPTPVILDVATDTARALAQPPASDGPFVFAGWLTDGRLLFVGKKVWVGDKDGGGMRVVADTTAPDGWPDVAVPSPDGRVALAYRDRVMILDLRTGSFVRLSEPLVSCPNTINARSLTWSLDGARLAGLDCDPSAGLRVKIVDVRASRLVAIVAIGAESLSTFPTGELLVVGPSEVTGSGAPSLGHVLNFDGVEKTRYRGAWWTASPDGRYLLQVEPTGGAGSSLGTAYTLIDRRTGARTSHFLPWMTLWLADGRLAAF